MDSILFALILMSLISSLLKKKKGKKNVNSFLKKIQQKSSNIEAAPIAVTTEETGEVQAYPNCYEHEPLEEGNSHSVSEKTSNREIYMGSLHETSTEGEDLCDSSLEHMRPTTPETNHIIFEDETGEVLNIDFSSNAILQGVVMSEILKRPSIRQYHTAGKVK